MIELRPCPGCRRHVGVREVACPFCAVALPPGRAQHVVVRGRVTRAAVFGAALAASGCGSHDEPARPVPAGSGSADMKELERILDDPYAGREAVPPPPRDAAPDAVAIGPAIDAGAPADAAPDADAVARREAERKRKEAERRRHEEERRLEAERQRRETERQLEQRQLDQRHMAKPYGAPPARRRVV